MPAYSLWGSTIIWENTIASARQVAGQMGDTVETVTRLYLKPETVGLDAIDRAYSETAQVSRNCPVNIAQLGDIEGFGTASKLP